MNLGEALYRFISGGVSSGREDPRQMAKDAQRIAGGVTQTARALGISRTTVQRWNKGSVPTEESTELLRAALRRARLSGAKENRIRGANSLTVKGRQDNRGGGSPERSITMDNRYLMPGTMDKVIAAYLRGASPRALQATAWQGIHNAPFYKALFYPGGPGAQPGATAAQPAATSPGPGNRPSGTAPAGGGRYGYYDDDQDLAYEGMALDDEYALAVSGVHT